MAELKGSLGSLGLPAIVQLIGELRHSGNLELTRNASRGVLGFDDGRLVAASYQDQSGLRALATCAVELADGEFLFVEGTPAGERTLDLGGSDLQRLLARIQAGDIPTETPAPRPATSVAPPVAPGPCPFLGFVDDKSRHYSRPTALHRCYAAGAAALVTGQEQRELCLSERHPTCPRFLNATAPRTAAAQPAADSAPVAAVPPVAPPATAPPTTAPPAVPASVAARTAPASQSRAPTSGPIRTQPAPVPQPGREPAPSLGGRFGTRPKPSRRVLLTVGGLIVLLGALLLAVALFAGGFEQNQATVVGQPPAASTAVRVAASPSASPQPTVAPPVAAKPVAAPSSPAQTAIPAAQAVPSAAPVQASPAVTAPAPARPVPSPSAVPSPGQPLIDASFASGPQPGWLDNPPYAHWGDGAYLLTAAQPARFVAVGGPSASLPADVVVSASFRKTGGPLGGGYGLILRNQSPEPLNGVNQNGKLYVMEAGDRGEFGIWRRDGDRWIDVVPWTSSDSIRSGSSPNDLEVRAIGNQLTFSANGAELTTVHDDALATGGVGVFVGGDSNEVALDRFTVRAAN